LSREIFERTLMVGKKAIPPPKFVRLLSKREGVDKRRKGKREHTILHIRALVLGNWGGGCFLGRVSKGKWE